MFDRPYLFLIFTKNLNMPNYCDLLVALWSKAASFCSRRLKFVPLTHNPLLIIRSGNKVTIPIFILVFFNPSFNFVFAKLTYKFIKIENIIFLHYRHSLNAKIVFAFIQVFN